jgi:hypothetical protein
MELYEIIHILFFPGIILHESAHALACLLLNVPIKKIKFLSKKGGYVIHEDSRTDKIIVIALFPFIFNILIALICARIYLLTFEPFVKFLMIWIGLSALLFSIPSDKDADNSLYAIKKTYTRKQKFEFLLLKILLSPLVLILLIILGIFKVFDKFIVIRLILIALWLFLFII